MNNNDYWGNLPTHPHNMKAQHTPAPWTARQEGGIIAPWNVTSDSLAYVAGTFGRTAQEQEANARLIAAAPDLLAALQECLSVLECFKPDEVDPETTKVARVAIAKATEGTK
jgi:hypothetical protein